MRKRLIQGMVLAVALSVAIGCGASPTRPATSASTSAVGGPVSEGAATGEGAAVATAPAAAASTGAMVDGWCSQTGYRCAETPVQRSLVARVRAVSGPAGRSVIGSPWLTDAAGGDGQRMRNAIRRYLDWNRATGAKVTRAEIERLMRADLQATYTAGQQAAFVARIVARTPTYPPTFNGPIPGAPTDDQGALDYLGVLQQCKEFADVSARAAGGRTFSYAGGVAVSPSLARPGMGLYKLDASHAAIIVDIQWRGGVPIAYRLAESNFGGGWEQNPVGQTPWLRTLSSNRIVNGAGYKVVRFD